MERLEEAVMGDKSVRPTAVEQRADTAATKRVTVHCCRCKGGWEVASGMTLCYCPEERVKNLLCYYSNRLQPSLKKSKSKWKSRRKNIKKNDCKEKRQRPFAAAAAAKSRNESAGAEKVWGPAKGVRTISSTEELTSLQ